MALWGLLELQPIPGQFFPQLSWGKDSTKDTPSTPHIVRIEQIDDENLSCETPPTQQQSLAAHHNAQVKYHPPGSCHVSMHQLEPPLH